MTTLLMQQADSHPRRGTIAVKRVCLWATRVVPEHT